MHLKGDLVILRDMIVSDIDDRIYWETIDTEWQNWDSPWENGYGFNEREYRELKLYDIKNIEKENIRYSFEICINNEEETHIGWVSAYHIDDNYLYTKDMGKFTIGIDIPNINYRNKGYGTEAWNLYIDYILESGIGSIYTQTWSGNTPVIKLMEKLGFIEVDRKYFNREVKNMLYDSITFKLDNILYSKLRGNFK